MEKWTNAINYVDDDIKNNLQTTLVGVLSGKMAPDHRRPRCSSGC